MSSEYKTFYLPNEMCRRAGVSARFLSSTQVAVFPSQLVKPTLTDVPSPYTTVTEAKIFQIRPEVILFHPIFRRMLNEASGIFVKLQASAKTWQNVEDVLHYSLQYRSVIRACLENLKEEAMRITGPEKAEIYDYITILYSIECIWHLCEILFIQGDTESVVGMRLLEWVRFHIPKHERAAVKILQGYNSAMECCADYWPTVIGCLMQGRIDEVQLLLALHSNANTQPFRAVVAALRSMPMHADGLPPTEFNLRRRHWLVDAQSKLDGQMFAGELQLQFIMQLIVGEEKAWAEAKTHCEAWYELFAAWLLYNEPLVRTFDLKRYARKCVRLMGITTRHIDTILLAAMETNTEFLRQIQNMNENGWFITHLVDLLFHAGQLSLWKPSETSSSQFRESFLLKYGILLMEHHSLWQIGLNYLDHCPVYGLAAIEILLPRAARNERKATKLIREATKRRLYHIVHSQAKILCSKYKRLNRLGSAFIWALKSQDAQYISHLVNFLLKQYKASHVLFNKDLLSNLGACMLASDSLIFLAKYYEFRGLLDQKNYSQAAQTLVGLIGSKLTPKFFWDVMLTDTLNLLESPQIMFDHNASLIILHYLDDRGDLMEVEKVTMIRMALARNIAAVYAQPK